MHDIVCYGKLMNGYEVEMKFRNKEDVDQNEIVLKFDLSSLYDR